MWWRSVLFIGIVFEIAAILLPNIIWLISWITGKLCSFKVSYMPFLWTMVALMILAFCVVTYGHYVGRFQSRVTNVEYSSNDIPPAFNGFRIVHISDFHVDSFEDNPEAFSRIVDEINAQNADIILFTGDVTTTQMEKISKFENVLKSLKAKEGIFSVLGNHDFFIYCREYRDKSQRCAAADRLTTFEREKLGWRVLRNESFLVHRGNDSIAIVGVDNINGRQGFKTIQMGDLKKAIVGLDSVFSILMTHDPSHWEAEVLPESHIQITLSGHTHASQMRFFGWSPANFVFNECDGRYDKDNRMLYVNAGIGCTAPIRIACPAEITVISLISSSPSSQR